MTTGLDRTYLPTCGLRWLPVNFLLPVKYTLSYGIVSYRLSVCLPVYLCVRHTFCQVAYRSDPSTDVYCW